MEKNQYSKCYLFQDINYTTTNEEEQIDIFEKYCKFLNSLDCNFKITINNKNKVIITYLLVLKNTADLLKMINNIHSLSIHYLQKQDWKQQLNFQEEFYIPLH